MSEAYLRLRGVSKRFDDSVAVQPIDLEVAEGEFLSIIGPSGCGKTTTLRMIAGLERPTAGSIALSGRDITDAPPHERDFGMVFQRFALFPHKDVWHNVAYGMQLRKRPKDAIERDVAEMLERMGLADAAHRRVGTLSGGQQQRVGIARALITSPKLVLLDEPTGSLDARLQLSMQSQLKQLQRDLGITFIHVTHNQSEALAIADRVVVMNLGVVEQIGEPRQVFEQPSTRFVAEFVGRNNIVVGTVAVDGTGFDSPLGRLALRHPARAGEATAVLRADALRVVPPDHDRWHRTSARIRALEYTGSRVTWFLACNGLEITADVSAHDTTRLQPELDQEHPVWIDQDQLHFLEP